MPLSKTNEQEVLEAIKALPGSTVPVLAQLLDLKENSVATAASHLYYTGKLLREKVPNPKTGNGSSRTPKKIWGYTLNPDPKPVAHTRKLKAPTENGWQARVDELQHKITLLEQWKADALRRFPTLAVAPAVLRAREIFAATDDSKRSEAILRGEWDNSPAIRAIVQALEEGI